MQHKKSDSKGVKNFTPKNQSAGSKQNKSPQLSEAIDASVQDYIANMKQEIEEERNAKHEAYGFILSRGLFFEFKEYHEEQEQSNAYQTAKSWLMQLAVNRGSN